MALTEIQRPTKAQFYGHLQSIATEMNNIMHRWRDSAEFIGRVQTTDLDTMGVSDTDGSRTDLVEFRQAINDMIAVWDGDAVTPSTAPGDVCDKIRKMR